MIIPRNATFCKKKGADIEALAYLSVNTGVLNYGRALNLTDTLHNVIAILHTDVQPLRVAGFVCALSPRISCGAIKLQSLQD